LAIEAPRGVAVEVGGGGSGPAVVSLDGTWQLAIDPKNVGRDARWWEKPAADAKAVRVPWIVQSVYPAYHGVAWYWRDFSAPANPHPGGRYLIRFWAVDYLAEVWLNGVRVGGHEGSEGPFVLDVTEAIKPGGSNRLAVRVLNPTNDPIDGIALPFIPRRCKVVPFTAGALYNDGGIVDSVELLVVPPVRIARLDVVPDPATGDVAVQATVHNALPHAAPVRLECTLAPAASGETLHAIAVGRELPLGETVVTAWLHVDRPQLWELNSPHLYRVTARVSAGAGAFHEQSTRCGFRDFRFEKGHFRLNGKRVFVKCSHTATHYPIGQHWPHDPDLARRDLLNVKAMGFNAIRFFCSVPARYQLELCDEIGLMIYEESFAGWFLQDSPKMAERFDREVAETIHRDRNHPSVVMWGLLNENPDGPVFRHAVEMLPFVRELDNTRIVMLNSGRFDVMGGGGPLGVSFWRPADVMEPNVTFNGTKAQAKAWGIVWEPGQLALHPGPKGEYGVLRFTAPAEGKYAVEAAFAGIAERATTDVHVLVRGKSEFNAGINVNGAGNEAKFASTLSLKAGETVDFAVGFGNEQYGGDTTAIAATLKAADGKTYDASRAFSAAKNPNGPWSYGFFPAGGAADAKTFKPLPRGETIGGAGPSKVGSLANPGSKQWEDIVSDQHPYKRVPHTATILQELRQAREGNQPVFISEYGIGSGVDYARITRHFEQLGAERMEDAQWYRERLGRFTDDWNRWKLGDTFASPETFFQASLARMGRQRLLGLNAIRANPRVIGHSVTGTVDQANTGEGLFTTFRELKPGTVDSVFDGWYPLRWCLFVEPVNVYRKTPVRLEAVLANEDALAPGKYPARIEVVGPGASRVFARSITVTIPEPRKGAEPPFAMPVFSEEVVIDGPPGKYALHATFEKGAAAAGRETEFYVDDAAGMPPVRQEVVVWGQDPELVKWLGERGVRVRPFAEPPKARELILVARTPAGQGDEAAFAELAQRIARGSAVVFLSPSVFAKKGQPTAFVPLANKGSLTSLPSWLYHKDEWAKKHPIFEGLPCGGLMDYTFYREIIPDVAWTGQDPPPEAVAGATNTSVDYAAGLLVSVHELAAGRFLLNTLQVRENLGQNPVAERLLRNMLNHMARDLDKPLAPLPDDFNRQLQSIGYLR
jgi:hypothetical protein